MTRLVLAVLPLLSSSVFANFSMNSIQNLSVSCGTSNNSVPAVEARLDDLHDENSLFDLLRIIKIEDSQMPDKEYDEEFFQQISKENNRESITMQRLGGDSEIEISTVVMGPYKSGKDYANGKQWMLILEKKRTEKKWKTVYALSVCGPLAINDFIPNKFNSESNRSVISTDYLARELKIDRKDFVLTSQGLQELQIRDLLVDALKPYSTNGEHFEMRKSVDWKHLLYKVQGKLVTDCNACTSGTSLEINFKWEKDSLRVAKVVPILKK
jgi:hypothetical protein